MSEENVEIVRRAHAAADAGDFEGWLACLHPAVEWDTTASHYVEGGRKYEGHAGVRSYFRSWLAAWQDFHVTVEEVIPFDDQVIVVLHESGTSKTTGIPLDQHPAFIWTIRDGVAVRIRVFDSKGAALKAAGLSEDDAHSSSS
jgi:ketosteroid isomerase-like protein